MKTDDDDKKKESLPSRERGLKFVSEADERLKSCRSLRGSVD